MKTTVISICPKEVAGKFWSLERFGHENEKVQQYEYLFIQQWSERDNWLVVVHIKTTKVLVSTSSVFFWRKVLVVLSVRQQADHAATWNKGCRKGASNFQRNIKEHRKLDRIESDLTTKIFRTIKLASYGVLTNLWLGLVWDSLWNYIDQWSDDTDGVVCWPSCARACPGRRETKMAMSSCPLSHTHSVCVFDARGSRDWPEFWSSPCPPCFFYYYFLLCFVLFLYSVFSCMPLNPCIVPSSFQ